VFRASISMSSSQEASTPQKEMDVVIPKAHVQFVPSPLKSSTLVYMKKGKAKKDDKMEEVIDE
ncbi:hypothetical protein KI387_038081, partial [Taxus chinensis]